LSEPDDQEKSIVVEKGVKLLMDTFGDEEEEERKATIVEEGTMDKLFIQEMDKSPNSTHTDKLSIRRSMNFVNKSTPRTDKKKNISLSPRSTVPVKVASPSSKMSSPPKQVSPNSKRSSLPKQISPS
jgi:hypothetical protein